jgi:pectate lyase
MARRDGAGRRCGRSRSAAYAVAGLIVLAPACGTDVAQTAVYVGVPAPLDCTPPSTPVELPSDPNFGGTATPSDWVLATGDYGAGRGPGITVAALDGFRLFVNGHLLATSTASLVPTFVPLTLLPGNNAIAVVVTGAGRAPVLLAQVDELERTYTTDKSWKVTMDPPSGFSDPAVDASQWATALDRGTVAQSPTCDPGLGFPTGSDPHFIAAPAAGSAVFRLDVPIAPIGFAQGTTGGGNTEPVVAKTADDIANAVKGDTPKVVIVPEGALDVRRTGKDVTQTSACPTACPDGSDMLTYNLLTDTETCPVDMVPASRNERRIKIGSNTTLVGLGRGAALLGGSLDVDGTSNVIVRNLVLYGVNPGLIEAGDGITLDNADGVWVDHATFWRVSDGFIDSTTGSQHVTLSWILNDGENPQACQGRHPRSNDFSVTTATIHHTLWKHVNGRAPIVTDSGALVHLFDNMVDDDVGYAVGSSCDAQVLLQNSVFQDVKIWTAKFECSDNTDLGLIHAADGNNLYTGLATHQSNGVDAPEPADSVFTPPYAYTPDPVDQVQFVIPQRAGAGALWALPLSGLPL